MRSARKIIMLVMFLGSVYFCWAGASGLSSGLSIELPVISMPEKGTAPESPYAHASVKKMPQDLGLKTCPPDIIDFLLFSGYAAPTPVIPEWYYTTECQQPPGMDVFTWLEALDLGEYVGGQWDCSERSAYVEWLLTNCGYYACFLDYDGHVAVIVQIGDPWYVYETQYNGWTAPGPGVLGVYLGIREVSGDLRWLIDGYDWWLEKPELVDMRPEERLR